MPAAGILVAGAVLGAVGAIMLAVPTFWTEVGRRRRRGERALERLGLPRGSFDFPLTSWPVSPGAPYALPLTVTLRQAGLNDRFYSKPIDGGVNAYRIALAAAASLTLTDTWFARFGFPALVLSFALAAIGSAV